MSKRLLFAAVLLFAGASPAQRTAQSMVSVRLFSKQRLTSCQVGSLNSQFEIRAAGKVIARGRPSDLWQVSSSGAAISIRSAGKQHGCSPPIYIQPQQDGQVVTGAGSIPPRAYFGRLRLSVRGGELIVVNELDIGHYLRCVVPSEVPRSFPPEALKAQAIVARTWAYRNRGRHHEAGYDFCDLTHCQAYKGAAATTPETDQTVAGTQGLVITWHGKLILPVYHSTCGGHTAGNDQVWNGIPLPYLRGVSDGPPSLKLRGTSLNGGAYCAASPHARWQMHLTQQQLATISHLSAPLGFTIIERDTAGRAKRVRITNATLRSSSLRSTSREGEVTMTGYQFYLATGRALGWNRVKSAWFEVKKSKDGFDLTGKGLGHGVGLCQWGANGLAATGSDCRAILRHYYHGVEITSVERVRRGV